MKIQFPYLTLSAFFSGAITGASVAGHFGFMGAAFCGITLFCGLWGATMIEVLGLAVLVRVILTNAGALQMIRRLPEEEK